MADRRLAAALREAEELKNRENYYKRIPSDTATPSPDEVTSAASGHQWRLEDYSSEDEPPRLVGHSTDEDAPRASSSSANPSRTSASNNNAVERKKNAATGSAARRKLTPHPLSNPDHPDMHLQEMVTFFSFTQQTVRKSQILSKKNPFSEKKQS